MKNSRVHLAMYCAVALSAMGCAEKAPVAPVQIDEDVVTTVTVVLKPMDNPMDSIVVVWEDIDGVGGAAPNRIDTLRLSPGATYSCRAILENRSATPTVDVTKAVASEKDNHQFFYSISNDLGIVTVTDTDSRGLPVGLTFTLKATSATPAVVGKFSLSLSHFDNSANKNGSTPSDETDVAIELPTLVK